MRPASPSGDDATRARREVNNMRFVWHEQIIANLQLTRSAIAFGGHIMHLFHADKGYAGDLKQCGRSSFELE